MLYYAIGTALLTRDEVRSTGVAEKVLEFSEAPARALKKAVPFQLPNGVLAPSDFVGKPVEEEKTGFTPIGLAKPLTIDIREVYTGQHPGWIHSIGHSMLVTSAAKSISTYDAKPRAINFLTPGVKPHSTLKRPAASEQGTPVVFYSPAMVDRSITLDVNMVFDAFPKQAFDVVGAAFTQAASVPVFVAQSFYLVAAGQLASIAGAMGEALFDGKPVLRSSDPIDLELPGATPRAAGFMLVTPTNVDDIDPTFRDAYSASTGTLIDSKGKPYRGDIPYVILAVDGAKRPELEAFAPTAASAAVLSRFLGINETQGLSLDPLLDALTLYNDFKFRSAIDRIDSELKTVTDATKKADLQKEREAYLKNISKDVMKPKP